MSAVEIRQGTLMCAKHARQAARLHVMPTGECEPDSEWLNGYGETMTCDVIANPEKVARYVQMCKDHDAQSAAKRVATPPSGPSGDREGGR